MSICGFLVAVTSTSSIVDRCLDHSCNDGVLGVGWGSGFVVYYKSKLCIYSCHTSQQDCKLPIPYCGWWSYAAMSYLRLKMSLQPLDAISDRANTDGTSVSSWTFSDDAGLSKDTAAGKDVALVFITADSGFVFCTFLPLG